MSDDVRDEFVRGWSDASDGVKFREFESRPWKNGWRLFEMREAQRRHWARIPSYSGAVH